MVETVSYELAEKLHKANLVKDCNNLFFNKDGVKIIAAPRYTYWHIEVEELCFAPTLTELLKLMPPTIKFRSNDGVLHECRIQFIKWLDSYDFLYKDLSTSGYYQSRLFNNVCPAEACGELLLWLKENSYIK